MRVRDQAGYAGHIFEKCDEGRRVEFRQKVTHQLAFRQIGLELEFKLFLIAIETPLSGARGEISVYFAQDFGIDEIAHDNVGKWLCRLVFVGARAASFDALLLLEMQIITAGLNLQNRHRALRDRARPLPCTAIPVTIEKLNRAGKTARSQAVR
jgi:hypothetical protein